MLDDEEEFSAVFYDGTWASLHSGFHGEIGMMKIKSPTKNCALSIGTI
jgi:hypothetical protein